MKKNLSDWVSVLLGAVVVCSLFCVSIVAYAAYCGEGKHSSNCDATATLLVRPCTNTTYFQSASACKINAGDWTSGGCKSTEECSGCTCQQPEPTDIDQHCYCQK